MIANTFLRGLLFGLAIAAPVGPIGLLCIQRTLNHGRLAGFLSGLGAASADAVYGAVAAFGLSLVADFLVAQQQWLQLVGGSFIVYLGVRVLRRSPARSMAESSSGSLPGMYGSTMLLTISNPVTILSFTAVFAGFGWEETGRAVPVAAALVGGVFVGSALWWLTLSTVVGVVRHRLQTRVLRAINVASGVGLVLFGVALLWPLLPL